MSSPPPTHAPTVALPGRLNFLDALRGWAIVLVIFNHAGSFSQVSGTFLKLSVLGTYGVQLFFVVSAYTIFLTYSKAIQREAAPTTNFLTRRLFRIVPVYWLGIVLYTAVYGQGSRGVLPGPELWHYPLHFLLLNIWHPQTSSSVVPGGWSISVEVMFYLSMPLWIKWVRSQRDAVVFAVVSGCAGTALSWMVSRSSFFHQFSALDMELFVYRLPTNQLACFAMGGWLYFAIQDNLQSKVQSAWRCVTIILVAMALFYLANRLLPFAPLKPLFAALAFCAAALALAGCPIRILVNSKMVFMGRISYSAYLIHFLVLKQLTLQFAPAPTGGYFLLIGFVGLALTIPLAWLGLRYIETPAIEWGRGIIHARERRLADRRNPEISILLS